MIPLGNFGAQITYLGMSTQINGDASKQNVTEAKVVISYPTIAAIAIVAAIVSQHIILRRRRSGKSSLKKREASSRSSVHLLLMRLPGFSESFTHSGVRYYQDLISIIILNRSIP